MRKMQVSSTTECQTCNLRIDLIVFTPHLGFTNPGTIVVLPVGTVNARFKQRAKSYNMLGMFVNRSIFFVFLITT